MLQQEEEEKQQAAEEEAINEQRRRKDYKRQRPDSVKQSLIDAVLRQFEVNDSNIKHIMDHFELDIDRALRGENGSCCTLQFVLQVNIHHWP
jgi:hypothetical protein